MEEKKQIKVSLKSVILLFIIFILLTIAFVMLNMYKKNSVNSTLASTNSFDYRKVTIYGKTYYQRLTNKTWTGEYHQDNFFTVNRFEYPLKVVSYMEYTEIINSINNIVSTKISKYYSNEDCNYIILSYANGLSWCEMELIDCFEENNKVIIYGNENVNDVMADGSGYLVVIPTNMPIGTEIEYRECYSSSEINNLKEYNSPYNPSEISIDKPIIYLYPTEETELTVKLGNPSKVICSYPNYTTEWNVIAKTNGDLIDLKTNKNLYALYYESEAIYKFEVKKDGFVVNKKDITEFLEEKLALVGLTERESEEFIVYWLPKLQENEYNYIRFATREEIDENMSLDFSVEPDTLIRVLMTYKGLDEPIEIEEQHLQTPERKGFVAVEWGGTEIK